MGLDLTLAGILQDLSLVIPTDAASSSVSVTLSPVVDDAGVARSVGVVTATFEVEDSHAPGVERTLLEFERVAGFDAVYLSGSTIDEDDISSFTLSFELTPTYLTHRFRDGLPEELR